MDRLSPVNSVKRLPGNMTRYPRRISFGVWVILTALVIGGWLLAPSRQSDLLQRKTHSNLEHLSAQLEAHILTRLTIAEYIRRQMAQGHIQGKISFLAEAHSAYELFSDFQAINWVDPDGVIRWIYPYKQNLPALNLNVRNLPEPKAALKRADETGKPQLTAPITLQQGGNGFVAYIPIIRAGKNIGYLDIVFRAAPLVQAAIDGDLLSLYDVLITDGDKIVFKNRPISDRAPVLSETINVGNRQWKITMSASDFNTEAHDTILDELVLAALLVLTAVVSILLYLTLVHQAKLRENDALFRSFMEFSPSAVNIKDLKGRYLHVNTRWQEWFNPENLPIIGNTLDSFFSEEHIDAVRYHEKNVVKSKRPSSEEYQRILADGRTVSILFQKFPILNAEGEVIALGTVNTDITANKRTEETLRLALMKAEEASQSKSKFLATMSHELRTPLNAIIGFSDILTGQYFGDLGNERYLDYAKDINASGKHLLSLIDEVLDISAIELGKRKLVMEPVSIAELLKDCINMVSQRAEQRDITIELRLPGNLPDINADMPATRQIFLNLLANSLKFSHPGDDITLSASDLGQQVEISVADTGIGIRKEHLATVVEPFVKGENSSLVANEGVGLGLSIVKSIVTAQRGTLDIESELGLGTKVTVTFPKWEGKDRNAA
ncbi:MAG: PAS domain S-box protein [Alphaproteobacteria bacterium]|nr:MAG: PAS domain S-box protein [Alphaproteobacteria bacterium]